jgi:hypothetical protein
MGAEVRELTIYGPDVHKAWEDAVAEDVQENGSALYNSGLCHIDGINEVDEDWFRREENGEVHADKYNMYFCMTSKPIPNKNKIQTEVIRHPNKGTRKWVTKYKVDVKYRYDENAHRETPMFDKQADAIKKARELSAKDKQTYEVTIEKVLTTSQLVADIKYKKSTTERNGQWRVLAVVPC